MGKMARSAFRPFFLAALLLATGGCCTSSGSSGPQLVAVRECSLVFRTPLPLTSQAESQLKSFIATQAGVPNTPQAIKPYVPVLDVLKKNFKCFDGLHSVLESTTGVKGVRPVIDATQPEPDNEKSRFAFPVNQFWFVIYANVEDANHRPLTSENWTPAQVVVFKK